MVEVSKDPISAEETAFRPEQLSRVMRERYDTLLRSQNTWSERIQKKRKEPHENLDQWKERLSEIQASLEEVMRVGSVKDQKCPDFDEKYHRLGEENQNLSFAKVQFVRRYSKRTDTKTDRAERMFAHPEHWIVPNDKNPRQKDITELLFSGDRIPDSLAEGELGMTINSTASKWQQTVDKCDPVIINRLKDLLIESELLAPNNPRIMVTPSGSIIMNRERPHNPSELMAQFYNRSTDSFRKSCHQDNMHKNEVLEIATILSRLERLIRILDQRWKNKNERKTILEYAKNTIGSCVDQLGQCRNQWKEETQTYLDQIKDLTTTRKKDGAEIRNVTASMAKMVASKNRLTERLDEIEAIEEYNSNDSLLLLREIGKGESVFHETRETVFHKAKQFDSSRLLSGKKMTPKQVTDQTSNMLLHLDLGIDKDQLGSLRTRPYRTFAKEFLALYRQVPDALRNRDRAAFRELSVGMHVIGKFQELERCFSEIFEYCSSPSVMDISQVLNCVENAQAVLDNIDLFPETRVKSLVPKVKEMQKTLQDLRRGLEHHKRNGISGAQLMEMYERMKKFMKEHDPEDIVNSDEE